MPLETYGTIGAIPDRKITKEACKKFGITQSKAPNGSIEKLYLPYYNKHTGEHTASKKRIVGTREFPWTGVMKDLGLFGQQTCKGRGKYITITEGELDAVSVSQMFDLRWDVVSLKDGAQSARKAVVDNLEFLEQYDHVVLCFDNDQYGKDAEAACRDLFSPGKVRIVQLPDGYKDANEMLEKGKQKEFISSWYDAKQYNPEGIVSIEDTWESVLTYRDTPFIPYPWSGLNDLLLGQRTKEVVVWAADTGIGKSQTMREIQHFIVNNTDDRVGCMMLEESIAKTTLGWMSFMAERPLHKELSTISEEELRGYWEQASAGGRFVLLDNKGWGNNLDTLKSRIRYMRHGLNCKWIVLDHLHIALSSIEGAQGDWSGIDELMTDLTRIAVELDIGLHLVSHTSGERTLRGSKGISKLADAVIYLERDKHNDDPYVANTTRVVVDKNRFVGDVGTACWLHYDKQTGRMTEVPEPDGSSEPEEF